MPKPDTPPPPPPSRSGEDPRFALADGRIIGYREFGTPAGRPVIALHGTPGSRLKFSATDVDAKALGLRVIAPDRWGYGTSDAHPAPSLAAYAADIATLADRLGLASFGVIGVSGGGPFAAACAAILGPRVSALALVSPVGPLADADGLTPAGAAMSLFHKFCFRVLPRSPASVRAIFRAFRFNLALMPRHAIAVSLLRAPKADRDLIAIPSVRERLTATFIEGLRPGLDGPAIDLKLFGAPWSLPLERILAPAQLWLGTEDSNVPQFPARALAEAMPDCELTILAGAGHLWVSTHYGEVLGWLAAVMQGVQSTTP